MDVCVIDSDEYVCVVDPDESLYVLEIPYEDVDVLLALTNILYL